MTTVEDLRKHCESLRSKLEEDLKSVLNDYFEYSFISAHKPWRAVIGNKKCKPIPIHRDFWFPEEKGSTHRFQWPNFSEEYLRSELAKLGFVVTDDRISISVPAYEKGKELTFAQEWVRKINASYSKYCENEKRRAKNLYPDFILKLLSTPVENIEIFDEYVLFSSFKFEPAISGKCYKFMRRLMLCDGIEELYENGKYKGIKVLHQPPN